MRQIDKKIKVIALNLIMSIVSLNVKWSKHSHGNIGTIKSDKRARHAADQKCTLNISTQIETLTLIKGKLERPY